MRANVRMFWILAGFFFAAAIGYTLWSAIDYNNRLHDPGVQSTGGGWGGTEWVGTVALTLVAAMSAFIAFYLGRTHKAQGGELPEDRLDAEIDDGDAEQGHFSPWSWWPFLLAIGAALVFLGVGVGIWISLIGLPIVIVSLIGWQFEYYRGNFGR